MESDLNELQAALGHRFGKPELLVHALTHRSLANELAHISAQEAGNEGAGAASHEDNERLEFSR